MLKFPSLYLTLGLCLLAPTVSAEVDPAMVKADQYLQAQDYRNARQAYLELAKQGSFKAQYMLAEIYQKGLGTRTDLVEAYAWSTLAAESKRSEYLAFNESLRGEVQDVDAADKLAAKYLDKYGLDAQYERAHRLAARDLKKQKCTGSRLSCGKSTQVYDTPIGGDGAMVSQPTPVAGGN